METMQIQFTAKNKVEVRKSEIHSSPNPTQVLIETAVSMVSPGTELAALSGTHSKSNIENRPAWLSYPSIPGYLATGTVVETGSAVRSYKKGDRVVCEGPGVWNSHSSHLIMEESDFRLVPVADGVSFEEAVFTKMGSIAMTGIRVCKPELGDSIAVMGLGLVGQIATRLAALTGPGRLFAVDPMTERRRLCEGLPGVIPVTPDDMRLRCCPGATELLGGIDHVIEASGHPSAFITACEIARIRGKIAVLSSPHKHFEIRLYDHIHSKGLQILGAHGFVLANPVNASDGWSDGRQRRLFMQLLSEKRISVKPLISHKVDFSRAPEIYQGMISKPSDYLGAQLYWNGYQG